MVIFTEWLSTELGKSAWDIVTATIKAQLASIATFINSIHLAVGAMRYSYPLKINKAYDCYSFAFGCGDGKGSIHIFPLECNYSKKDSYK